MKKSEVKSKSGRKRSRKISAVCIAALCISFGLASAGDGKMVFLTVVQKSNSIRVIEARVVAGTPRGRSCKSFASALYEQRTAAGRVLETGPVPMPPPVTFDIPDSSGRLSGGVVNRDSVVFSFRVPYRDSAATLRFYSVNDTGPAGGAEKRLAKGTDLGSFDLNKAVK